MSELLQEAARALCAHDNILILTHRRPDGDTTGCAGALCRGLRQLGKRACILPNPEITARYAPMITSCYPNTDFVPEYIVTTDIADYQLFSDNAEEYKSRIDLVIDHHRSNRLEGGLRVVRPEAGACAEIIFDLLGLMGVQLTREIASCIYVAVSTDTGCFKYSNTVPHTHETAAACLAAGVDGGEINRALFETKSVPRFQMERILFDTMEFLEDGRIALATLWRADIDRTGADMDDLDSIASLPRQIEGVQVGITLTENRDGSCKASVRTTREIDASAICAKCGGGGHLRAGGASFAGGVAQAREALLRATAEVYRESELA